MDQTLEALADSVLRPLPGEVGDDLAQTNSPEFLFIRNQYDDKQRRNFSELFEKGEMVLRDRSKDLWAAWALVGGLLWSKRFDRAEGFAASCRAIRRLCERYWDQMYPQQRSLRNTLLDQIAIWWNTYVVTASEGAPRALLAQAMEDLVALQQHLFRVTEGASESEKQKEFRCLGTIGQVIRGLSAIVTPAASQAAAPAGPADTNGQSEATLPAPAAATSATEPAARATTGESLEAAFERSLTRLKEGKTEQGLMEFQERLKACGRLSDRVRGRVLLGELYLKAGLSTHAKRVLQYTHDEVEKIKLSDWDPVLCSRLWSNLIQAHQKAKDEKPNENLLAELFANLCLIDPATAASLEPIKKA